MIKLLLRIAGVLIAVGGVAAAWMGLERVEDIRKLDSEIYVQLSQGAFGGPRNKEKADKKIEETKEKIETTTTQRNIWLGAAAVALIVGLGMALLPSSRKRKVRAARSTPTENAGPVPAQNPEAPTP
jgi:hypothetical protein